MSIHFSYQALQKDILLRRSVQSVSDVTMNWGETGKVSQRVSQLVVPIKNSLSINVR